MKNTETKQVVIGSRGSDLALWQAHFVQDKLAALGVSSSITIIKTKGDKIQDLSFDKIEGKGFFTKEIEDALLAGTIDLAVHSHKDLETNSPAGLAIAAVSDRADAAELLLIRKDSCDHQCTWSLKMNAVVGTSSARRKAQLLMFRPDVEITDLRGNVPTRIEKLRSGKYDAILLAGAGINRLGINLDEFHVERLEPKEFIPAPAQGVLALQIRENDHSLFKLLQDGFNHVVTENTSKIERLILNRFQGGCQLPLGALCEQDDDGETYKVWLSVAKDGNSMPVAIYAEGTEPDALVDKVVSKARELNTGKVFISRNLVKNDLFAAILTAHGYGVNGKTLIETKQVKMIKHPQTDWIFFSSKNAVYHFFSQQPEIGEAKIGVIGKSTADALRKFNRRADFIGGSTDTKLVGRQFQSRVGSGSVLFPQAKESMRTVQSTFRGAPNKLIDQNVYETLELSSEGVDESDILVFTSPSNVESFLKYNRFRKEHRVVAIGHATVSALRSAGVSHPRVADGFSPLALARAVMST